MDVRVRSGRPWMHAHEPRCFWSSSLLLSRCISGLSHPHARHTHTRTTHAHTLSVSLFRLYLHVPQTIYMYIEVQTSAHSIPLHSPDIDMVSQQRKEESGGAVLEQRHPHTSTLTNIHRHTSTPTKQTNKRARTRTRNSTDACSDRCAYLGVSAEEALLAHGKGVDDALVSVDRSHTAVRQHVPRFDCLIASYGRWWWWWWWVCASGWGDTRFRVAPTYSRPYRNRNTHTLSLSHTHTHARTGGEQEVLMGHQGPNRSFVTAKRSRALKVERHDKVVRGPGARSCRRR